MRSERNAVALKVNGLGKRYELGQRESYQTIRGLLSRSEGRQRKGGRKNFWALRNICFEVEQGEVLGVIGHNGAGKSTLLKLLARVTSPTEGSAELFGRVSALLEVGTGFHPELTGRENVFLNGSILGMRQQEIRNKFDEIVDFAEISEFIDTPMKRYSSGMQVRLAFAVAAFLEPEILIVDEVLAVGDVAFQRKCLDQIGSSSRSGRTVLFVSHNLPAIRSLCQRSILLSHGELIFDGSTEEAIAGYLPKEVEIQTEWLLSEAERPQLVMRQGVLLRRAELLHPSEPDSISTGSSLRLSVDFEVVAPVDEAVFVVNVSTTEDVLVAQTISTLDQRPFQMSELGPFSVQCTFDDFLLQPGRYWLSFGIRSGLGLEDQANRAALIEVTEASDVEFPWFSSMNGYVRLPSQWNLA